MEIISNFTKEELKEKSGIYKITNVVNGKFYIGSAINLYRRAFEHGNSLNKNKHDNRYLQNSWNKHGEENFTFEVIEYVKDETILFEREQYWMDNLHVTDRNIGYNINPSATGRRGAKLTKEQRENLSIVVKNYLANLSEDEKKELYKGRGVLISKAKLAKKHKMSDEARMKMSIAKKGIKLGERPQEVKDKISNSKMGHINTPLGSSHWNSILDDATVTRIKTMLFDGISVNEISEELNVNTSSIYDIKTGRSWSHILPELDLSKNKRAGKLNAKKVKDIKLLLRIGKTPNEIANEYGVSPTTIRDINRGKTWSNVVIEEVV